MKHGERGASMVEFAIASTAIMLVMFGILEFGRALYIYHTVSNAARIGSRWAMVRGSGCDTLDHCGATSSDIADYVTRQVPMLDSGTLTVTAKWSTAKGPSSTCTSKSPTGDNASGYVVCVTASYPFNFAIPFVSNTPLTISSTSSMVISQ